MVGGFNLSFLSGASSVGSGALNILIVLVLVGVVIGIVVGVFFWLRRGKRFKQFKVIIWEVLESGGVRESYDYGGIFTMAKTGNKLFYLKRSNVGLKPDNVSYLVNARGKKVVYLLRYGFKNFVFINPVVSGDGKVSFKVGEEDVNWAINSYEANKKRFSQSLLMQLLPFMILALVCMIILIMMIYLFKQFSVFRDVASAMLESAKVIASSGVNGNITGFVTSGGVI